MREYHFKTNGNTHWRRVNKATARRVFENDGTILLCPVKLRPDSMWRPISPIAHSLSSELDIKREFDVYVNEFEFYNCNNESGRYVAFYAEEK